MTAILLCEPLSSIMPSSSFGPTWRAVTVWKPWLKPNARTAICVKFPSRLNASSTIKIIAAIIQPRPLRGGAAGGAMTGGGVKGGGGEPPAGGGEEEVFLNRRRGGARQ